MIALITGGSGSGKSAYAEKLLAKLSRDRRVYIATMRVWDAESEKRVARHRAQRAGMGFATLECPADLGAADLPDGANVLLEDVPNLVANELFDPDGDADRILPGILSLAGRCQNLVLVTNDLFSDGGNYDPAVQDYVQRLARVNAALAAMADYAAEVVYTIPVPFKGERICV